MSISELLVLMSSH